MLRNEDKYKLIIIILLALLLLFLFQAIVFAEEDLNTKVVVAGNWTNVKNI